MHCKSGWIRPLIQIIELPFRPRSTPSTFEVRPVNLDAISSIYDHIVAHATCFPPDRRLVNFGINRRKI
jgi:hypothetical protein|tara:strand:- start:675 stop:881 length:207 start_codon:yes stop_codon:yes gene_type:complete